MKTKTLFKIFVGLVILLLIAGLYWYFFARSTGSSSSSGTGGQSSGFQPFGRTPNNGGLAGTSTPGTGQGSNPMAAVDGKPPVLRLLSDTPVGGYNASTTASTTIVRWIDRGRGNIYETRGDSMAVATLSNTLLPKVVSSWWNKNGSSFVALSFTGSAPDSVSAFMTNLQRIATTTSTTTTTISSLAPYNIKGLPLPSTITAAAVSPKKDRVFLFSVENGQGVGYIAPFGGNRLTQIFSTPVTQVNVDWPEENTITITTKGSVASDGYLYFVNPKTGVWKKVLGPFAGLSVKVSTDAKYAIVSATGNNDDVTTAIYSIATSSARDAVIRTLADKCAWGNFYKDLVYCAVPFQPVAGTYPDDWYRGTLSTADKIWQVDATTGEVKLISTIFDQSDRVIDIFNMNLDDKDDFLYFMNKNDLSLWSLDLIASTK